MFRKLDTRTVVISIINKAAYCVPRITHYDFKKDWLGFYTKLRKNRNFSTGRKFAEKFGIKIGGQAEILHLCESVIIVEEDGITSVSTRLLIHRMPALFVVLTKEAENPIIIKWIRDLRVRYMTIIAQYNVLKNEVIA